MKIIKQGSLPGDRPFRGTCRNCQTEIEFLQKEAIYHFDQRDGDYLSIGCPTCSTSITVAASRPPAPRR